jgi:DNA-directed RNA polymerase specialized sigma24 family protein
VAEQLEIKASHVRVLLSRARDALREKMKQFKPANFRVSHEAQAGESK